MHNYSYMMRLAIRSVEQEHVRVNCPDNYDSG